MGLIQEVGDRVQIMVHLQSRLDITKIFCDLDDFCKVFESMWKQAHLPQMGGEKLSRCRMCLSEIMTIARVLRTRYAKAFHGSGYRIFKELSTWVKRIRLFLMQEIDVYVYFNNDPDGNAIRDAQRLYSLLGCC
ncbi:DUF72 domain-containing protein [Nostoc sp.]|uniref:DUF72 domain-containing protein n=1 Tax=Nostoc sp. TaxID=1180 RepID=UPI002FF87238